MKYFVIRLFCILLGIFTLSITLSIGIVRQTEASLYALVVNTNFRDYD